MEGVKREVALPPSRPGAEVLGEGVGVVPPSTSEALGEVVWEWEAAQPKKSQGLIH